MMNGLIAKASSHGKIPAGKCVVKTLMMKSVKNEEISQTSAAVPVGLKYLCMYMTY